MWIVHYGRGRSVRVPGGTGGITHLKGFKDEASARAFVAQCRQKMACAPQSRGMFKEGPWWSRVALHEELRLNR